VTADEVYLWLLPVMAFGAFLLGGYLLVSGRQAKAAGAESHKVKFLGVEIDSSSSGTTLIILAIVVVVVVISLGIGRAVDDDGNGGDDPTDPTTTPTTTTTPTSNHTDDDDPEPSGLTEDNVVPTSELDGFTTSSLGITWARVDETRPALNCLQEYMKDQPGALKPLAFDKWRSNSPDATAEAATTVLRFSEEDEAEESYDRIKGWLDNCGDEPPLEGGRPLDVAQAGPGHDVNGRIYWRNYPFTGATGCSTCVLTDSQAVGRVDDTIVIFSIAWVDPAGFSPDGGPIEQVMQRALALAD
jgi:hypothetical protein